MNISEQTIELLKEKNIDYKEAISILEKYRNGKIGNAAPVEVTSLPGRESIVDTSAELYVISKEEAESFREKYSIELPPDVQADEDNITLTRKQLEEIGVTLMPWVAYGVLNGGSATSYADYKKNSSFHAEYLKANKDLFERSASLAAGKAKGITPAFIHPDGTPGPSYMELKMRALLIMAAKYKKKTGKSFSNPLFQMTSVTNDNEISDAYSSYTNSEYLKDLIEYTKIDITHPKTGKQPLISAYTLEEGIQKDIFMGKDGKTPLALPGGHGQNFKVLKDVYKDLEDEGKQIAYLGNVDNLGNMPDPLSVALMALKNPDAAFEFSYKTKVDIKGGILVRDQNDHLNCGDIGVAITKEDVAKAENEGKQILFNCATGIFRLSALNSSINSIIDTLPVRFSKQDKDAGKYSQAEQITWEIIGLLDNVMILGVNKYDRFIAAKLLLESFLASGIGLDRPDITGNEVADIGSKLHNGLTQLLDKTYGCRLKNGKWLPKPLEECL